MPVSAFEIHVCTSCGLRYPLTEENSFGRRCPHCLGETQTVLVKKVGRESISAKKSRRVGHQQRAVLLDNIRSGWNVGSILRSADGFGFDHAYLCGITPTPEKEAVAKTSLGAENFITWSYHKNAVELIKGLKSEGWNIYALEEGKNAIDIRRTTLNPKDNIVLMLGSEITGVDPGLLELADQTITIPMGGGKRSFNVSVAFAVAAYAVSGEKREAGKLTISKASTKLRNTSER